MTDIYLLFDLPIVVLLSISIFFLLLLLVIAAIAYKIIFKDITPKIFRIFYTTPDGEKGVCDKTYSDEKVAAKIAIAMENDWGNKYSVNRVK